jgi:hypothetical protein
MNPARAIDVFKLRLARHTSTMTSKHVMRRSQEKISRLIDVSPSRRVGEAQ